ncbi:putative Cyclin-like superfamily [Helianthus annuus]|uniref:Cyclin-like superfamily n=1 Tax=Helianthus annuus TaxID=4232 RepID=A0A251TEK9_HELAN|nr:cyclin-D4-1 [Helianthus annuus]KAF5784619.1 putative Cyclin-like superfamily [Helianthus annuus]KAJ0512282.1 putative cyclin domain-containing protein [Helianthus annuus]KAJ0528403.1 putative cyclin domain-containing protein [Helianthus annuus]
MANCLLSSLLCAEDNNSICYDDQNNVDEGLWGCGNDLVSNKNQCFTKNLETECCVLDLDLDLDLPVQSDECLCLLIEKECEQFVGFDYLKKLTSGKLDMVARQQAVDWILKVHSHFNFGPLCAYLSINYLDRFLAAYEFPKDKDWMMQLLAVTCLSLATKMEETEVPHILDLQVCESKYVFEAKTIQKMELLVLTTLKWRMQTVTPFSFIDAFIGKLDCGQPISRALISRSTQLILCLINGIDFLEFRPSEIAAGVAIYVVGQSQMAALFKHVPKEKILKCVELVNELSSGCTKMIMKSGAVPLSPIGVLEAACLSYNQSEDSEVGSSTSKRRRLNNTTPFGLEL